MCVYSSGAQPHKTPPCWQGAARLAALQGMGSQEPGVILWQVGAVASLARSQGGGNPGSGSPPEVRFRDRLVVQCSLEAAPKGKLGPALASSSLHTDFHQQRSWPWARQLSSPGWPMPHAAALSCGLGHPPVSRATPGKRRAGQTHPNSR